jgi:lipid A 3-O-deacylase
VTLIYLCKRFIFIFLLLVSASYATAEKKITGREAYAFYVENDSRNIGGPGSDNAYSNGLKFSYIYVEGEIPKWSKPLINNFRLLKENPKNARINFGFSIGHQIHTPKNTQEKNLIESDRPYAAWLYLGFAASLKELDREQFFEIDLGTIGPSALGKEIQNGFHSFIGTSKSQGWKNGLKDEPTLQLFYQNRSKLYLSKRIDFVPYYGAGFGNVLIGGHLGVTVRYGENLPDDFGSSRPSASDGNSFISTSSFSAKKNRGLFIFAGLRGNYTNKNILLDRNSYQSSHSIKKYPFTFETDLGLGFQYKEGILVWRFVTKSPEIQNKNEFNSFASVSFVYLN